MDVHRPLPIAFPEAASQLMTGVINRLSAGGRHERMFLQMPLNTINYGQPLSGVFALRFARYSATLLDIAIYREAARTIVKSSVSLQETTVKFMFLTTWLIDPPTADARKNGLFPEWPTCLGKTPQREKNPWIPRRRYRGLRADNDSIFGTLPRDWAIDYIAIRMRARKFNLPCHLFWQKEVIGIKVL
jgi:hypothetical protein